MIVPPIIEFDNKRISKNKLMEFLPPYTLESLSLSIGKIQYGIYKILVLIIKFFIKLRLRAIGNKTFTQVLSQNEVEHVYTREANTYEWKHHATTNFRDIWWRRLLAFDVLSYLKRNQLSQRKIALLDIGTGIGLSLEEMFKVFRNFNIKVFAYGLDFNQQMLVEANNVVLPRMKANDLVSEEREIQFVRGDGRNLSGRDKKRGGFFYFEENSIDCITLMFGIGGIDLPYDSLQEQLFVLKEKGIVTILDIHSPLLFFSNYYPWYLKFFDDRTLEFMAWKEGTVPLVLRKIWGWQDPTPIFYKAPLVTSYSKEQNAYFGFRAIHFSYTNEVWWFSLPFINTARLVMEKVKITEEEYKKRINILDSIF